MSPNVGERNWLVAIDLGRVKTQNWIDFRGALTIPGAKQIESRAIYEVVFNWHDHDFTFSHNLDPQESVDPLNSLPVCGRSPKYAASSWPAIRVGCVCRCWLRVRLLRQHDG